jgi:alpha-tubulin suppressor-like RCC1 family protein/tRNA A-37 threonylcarbamoyl transferase component Bud32
MSGDPTAAALSALDQRYEIVREVGRGGTALVYLARERSSGTEVAIKLIRAKYIEDEETVARFAREARYVGNLHHPNVVGLRSVVELGDLGLAIVMDHVRGQTLKQTIHEKGPLSPVQAESVLRDIAAALGAAHAMGIVHRDVKPENIFIDVTGRALLADFGVARSMTNETQLTMSGIAIGTPAYMAPEQIDGIGLDGRGDIYSLGLVGWEMLTGKRPWEGASLYAIIYRQKHEQLPDVRDLRPGIPDRLANVIAGAIEKDLATRWQSAAELIAALDGNAPFRAPQARPALSGQTRRFVRPAGPPEQTTKANVGLATSNREPATPSGAGVEALLAEIAATEFAEPARTKSTRWRLVVGGVAAVGLILAGVAFAVPRARATFIGRATGDVVIGTQAGTPSQAAVAPATDSTKRIPSIDSPKPETVAAIRPALVVAQASAEPSLIRLQRSSDRGMVVNTPASDTVQSSSTTAAAKSASRDATPSVAEAAAPPVPVARADPSPSKPPPAPIRPAEPTIRVSIATGGSHTCLLMASGRAFCWGGNDRGQLGSGSTARLAAPSAVASEIRFATVAPGLSHSCAVARGGSAWCWGENLHGQLGDRSVTSRLSPVAVADNHVFWSLSAGAAHTCGIDVNAKAWCWGSNSRGQLGIGDPGADDRPAPVAVATDRSFRSIALGWSFSCALDAAGAAFCWGENAGGQLGDGTREERRKPTVVRAEASFTMITAGSAHACGLTAAGEAYCWGRNTRGQLGDGTRTDQASPVRVKSAVRFVSISAGAVHTCAVAGDGTAYCWGQNTYGQLGDGGTTDHPQPVAVVGDHAFASVRAFGSHTCGATTSGEAFCWGYNLDGQLGDGTRVHRTRPVYVEPPSGQ